MATTVGSKLPFPTGPSASTAGYTLAESTHQRRVEPRHLPGDAPNILVVLLDDVGFGLSDVVGGEVRTPAFRHVAESGFCYNTFHTTLICSPTRTVDGTAVGSVAVARTVPGAFTASETFCVGVDLGSPVSPDYFDRRPFRFTGTIDYVDVEVFPPGTST